MDLLQSLAAEPGVVRAERLATILGRTNAKAVAAIVAATRGRLVSLTGDPDAAQVIVSAGRPLGYELDRTAAARYPVVVAALGDATP